MLTKEQIKEYSKQYYQKHKEQYEEHARKYYLEHKEQIIQKTRKYHLEHSEQAKKASRKYRRKLMRELRQKIIEKLGNKCIRCGFSDVRTLEIDHVHGGGSKERKEIHDCKKYYDKVLADMNENYQLLCANCNSIKISENGEYKRIC